MLQHLRNFSGPFVLAVSVLLLVWSHHIQWWHVSLMLCGSALWDFGWHARIHHADVWTANPLVRITGIALASVGVLLTMYV